MKTENLTAYLQHGTGGKDTNERGEFRPLPRRTESVPVLRSPMRHHRANLSYTATGYGEKIPTEYMVQWRNRWRRVYCRIFSNSGTLYIRVPSATETGGRIVVDIYQGETL